MTHSLAWGYSEGSEGSAYQAARRFHPTLAYQESSQFFLLRLSPQPWEFSPPMVDRPHSRKEVGDLRPDDEEGRDRRFFWVTYQEVIARLASSFRDGNPD